MPNQVIAIVLGTWTTKAVHLESSDEGFTLLNYSLQEARVQEKGLTLEFLTEHLKHVKESLNAKTRDVVLVFGMSDSILRHVQMPPLEREEMRRILKVNSKTYFQQDLSDYLFDCFPLRQPQAKLIKDLESPAVSKQVQVLVGGAKQILLGHAKIALAHAGLVPRQITISQLCLNDASRIYLREKWQSEVFALLDLGFLTSTISIVVGGEVALSRVVGAGGDKITHGLAEAFNITYPVAEGIKLVMPEKVEAKLETLLSGLSAELKTAIDFFEHNSEKRVGEVLISGGGARSKLIVAILAAQLGVPCRTWNPLEPLKIAVPPNKVAQLEKDSPQLASAVGAAVQFLTPSSERIDLLAEEKEAKERARRDPVRRAIIVSASVVCIMLAWAGWLRVQIARIQGEMGKYKAEITMLQNIENEVLGTSRKATEVARVISALDQRATNRFFWGSALNGLQQVVQKDIQVIHIGIEQKLTRLEKSQSYLKRPTTKENIVLTVQAKNYGGVESRERYIESLGNVPYFQGMLRKENPILLKSNSPRQVDPTDPTKTFSLFIIECVYADRIIGYD